MPRNVRNWWVECSIDGRVSRLAGGPVAKDGGITLRIFQRDRGVVRQAACLDGLADSRGHLTLTVHDDPDHRLDVRFDDDGHLTIQSDR